MSKYVENNLQNHETIQLKAKISLLAAFGNFVLALIFVALGIGVMVFGNKMAE